MTLAMPSAPPPPDPPPSRPRRRLRLVVWRPATRADCIDVPRPCPYVGCRYNLYLDVSSSCVENRVINPPAGIHGDGVRINRRGAPHEQDAASSCALDVAELGPSSQEEVAALIGVSAISDRVRRIEVSARKRLLAECGDELAALLELWAGQARDEEATDGEAGAPMRWYGEDDEPSQSEDVELWATQVAAYVRSGLRLSVAWALVNHQEAAMAKKNGTAKKMKANGSKMRGAYAPPGAVSRGEEMRELPIEIDDVEVAKLAKELGSVIGQRESEESELREMAGEARERIKDLKERESKLGRSVREHTRLQETRCGVYLLPNNTVQVVRFDTGEVVDERAPTAEELQGDIADAFDGESEDHVDAATVE